MDNLEDMIVRADRLTAITQRVGYALWQLQQLEGVTAQYFVLVVEAKRGMGVEAGEALTEKALAKTFGATVGQLTKAKRLTEPVELRFRALLAERNWLVHSSQPSSRRAVYEDAACATLIARLDRIADEAHALIRVIGSEAELFFKKHGVPGAEVDRLTAETLKRWHGEESE
jgi:hypothetical protein